MTTEELIEAAARALWKTWAENIAPDGSEIFYQKYTFDQVRELSGNDADAKRITDLCLEEARAVVSLTVEACAKKAASFPAQDHGHLSTDPVEASRQTAQEISSSIRALAPKVEG